MTQKELSSIANLIIEDEKYIDHFSKAHEHDISSWSMPSTESPTEKPKKPYLPPLLTSKKPVLEFPPPIEMQKNLKPSKQPHFSQEKVKLTELLYLESFNNSPRSKRDSFYPGQKEYTKTNKAIKECRTIKEDYQQSKYSHKMANGLPIPVKYYEKYMVHDLLNNKYLSKPSRQNTFTNRSRNEAYKDLISKITNPDSRSKSMLSGNYFDSINTKQKIILSRLLDDIY